MKKIKEQKNQFLLDTDTGYFRNNGVDVMAFDDIYPVGHQSGVSIIMHGSRIATNGDIRFEQTPGQWQPVPKQQERILDKEKNTIITKLGYPDYAAHLKGFNPMIYPDLEFNYEISVTGQEDSVAVNVSLDRPIPEKYAEKLCFNMELFPGVLFGKPWIMDGKQGIFPRQPNGPTLSVPSNYSNAGEFGAEGLTADKKLLSGDNHGYNPIIADDIIAAPYAVGKRFTICPDDPYKRLTIESRGSELKLYDGRMNHNNGWFVISSEIPVGATKNTISWVITPNVVEEWLYPPVVQVSQVGYHPKASKIAIVELDRRATVFEDTVLYKITEKGEEPVRTLKGEKWGQFLRYNYLRFDFTDIEEESLYQIYYGNSKSCIFRIAPDIYDRGVWQPVLEYFLPIQMCHMRVNEKYRVWHSLCHNDDARMAPVNLNHFDGYVQGPSTLTKYQPGEHVPGLNVGGWHDAGDYDLRVETQSEEIYILTMAYEAFHVDYDVTTIDQKAKITEIHQPDGKNDILQQIEHGALSIVSGYHALGRLYRGIIAGDLRQYVLLGDAAAMTNGIPGDQDDRWVFTEDNPPRELLVAAHLAAASRSLRDFNDALSCQALEIASSLYETVDGTGGTKDIDTGSFDELYQPDEDARGPKIQAAVELYLTTGEDKYKEFLLSEADFIVAHIENLGWIISRATDKINEKAFTETIRRAMIVLKKRLDEQSRETPYSIPYRPHIWGAGWAIQRLGFEYYFLHQAFPDIFEPDLIFHALNFVLGCHPGSNTASFASGVGAKSATAAYGANRADWSYIPGGVVSGTALIRPDFPELLEFPFLWQQGEYIVGGGSSCYMFLVLAAKQLLQDK